MWKPRWARDFYSQAPRDGDSDGGETGEASEAAGLGISVADEVGADIAGFMTGINGAYGTGYGFGGFGSTVGGITALGDFAGDTARDAGMSVSTPTAASSDDPSTDRNEANDPSAFGGGDQGNDMGPGSLPGGLTVKDLIADIPTISEHGLNALYFGENQDRRIEGADQVTSFLRRAALADWWERYDNTNNGEGVHMTPNDDIIGLAMDFANLNGSRGLATTIDDERNDVSVLKAARLLGTDASKQYTMIDREWGANADLNKQLASATGYRKDFSGGQFWDWIDTDARDQYETAASMDTNQNFGFSENAALNRAAASEFAFTGDFGGGRFQQHLADTGRTQEDFDVWKTQYEQTVNPSAEYAVGNGLISPGASIGGEGSPQWLTMPDGGFAPSSFNFGFDMGLDDFEFEIPEFNVDTYLSNLNETEQQVGAVYAGQARADEQARTNLSDMRLSLDPALRRSRRGASNMGFDYMGSGINF